MFAVLNIPQRSFLDMKAMINVRRQEQSQSGLAVQAVWLWLLQFEWLWPPTTREEPNVYYAADLRSGIKGGWLVENKPAALSGIEEYRQVAAFGLF
jgi:hypothetical protein